MMAPYDLEQVYDEQIAPLMTQIIGVCDRNGIPMVASFAYKYDTDGAYDFCTSSIDSQLRAPIDFRAVITFLIRQGITQ